YAYYGTERSRSAVWENRMTVDSRYQLITLDALSAAELLDETPFLVVHGKGDHYCTPEGAQAVFDRATGPKEIEWLASAPHTDLYAPPAPVGPAGAGVAGFRAGRPAPAGAPAPACPARPAARSSAGRAGRATSRDRRRPENRRRRPTRR